MVCQGVNLEINLWEVENGVMGGLVLVRISWVRFG